MFPDSRRLSQQDDPREAESRARERYFMLALTAAMFANVVFAALRFAGELMHGRATGYWINVFGAVALGLLTLYYRSGGPGRFRVTLHLGLAACAFCLVMPVRYGMLSSPWWLTIMPFAAALVMGARDGVVWVAISAVLMVGSHVWGPDLALPGAAGEDLIEGGASRVFLVLLLFAIATRSRWVADRQTEELREARDVLAQANAALERANQAKSTFLANVSHEIRTPLTGAIGMTELALGGTLTASQREYVQTAHDCATGLLDIVNDILDVSKVEAGRLDIETIPFSLQEALATPLRAIAGRAIAKGLEVHAAADPGVADRRIGDPLRVRQVVTNLLSNAVKFTAAGEVRLHVAEDPVDPDRVVVTVQDSGIGVPSEDQSKLFQPFSQADASMTRQFGGTGLGLSLSRTLARMMGGDLTLESQAGKGTTCRAVFRLPGEAQPVTSVPPGLRLVIVARDPALGDTLESAAGTLGAVVTRAQGEDEVAATLARGDVDVLVVAAGTGTAAILRRGLAAGNGSRRIACMAVAAGGAAAHADLPRLAVPVLEEPVFRSTLADGLARLLRAPEDGTHRQSPTSPDAIRMKPLRILVAEDNPVNQILIEHLLKRLGHQAVMTEDGTAALDRYERAGPFDLLLTDIQMPNMDGMELTQRIRALQSASGDRMPIVALTAHAMRGDDERIIAGGADAYLAKPIDARELRETLVRLAGD